MADLISNPESYQDLLARLKSQIRTAQVRAALAVNRELVLLYWGIGKEILVRQNSGGWGSKVVDRLAQDLRQEFPDMKGLSRTNLLYMRAFAETWPDESIVQQVVGQIPWGHNVRLLELVESREERLWYIHAAIENGWSRNVLVLQIESNLFKRQGKATTNFQATLPKPQSDLAQQLIKDPYNFDFLTLATEAQERDLEKALLVHLRQFLVELGVGFAFVGSQVPLEVGGEDFKLDLLFYHLKLRCYVAIDLKMGAFKPEYAGKLNFYLSAVDDMLRHPDDKPTIGLILCKQKNGVVAEYALRDIGKPLGISEFKHLETLPEQLKGTLPTIEEIEAELGQSESPVSEDERWYKNERVAERGDWMAATHTLIAEPDDGRALVLDVLNGAKSSIDLTIYELTDSQIIAALIAAQKRKVTVRVLYNWYSFTARTQQAYITPAVNQLTKAGIQCKRAPAAFEVTHEKAFAVDGTTGIVMSFNLVSDYFGTTRDFGIVTTVAAEVAEIEAVFQADWSNTAAAPKVSSLVWSPVNSRTRLTALINGASTSLDIYCEEFEDPGTLGAMVAAVKRGVKVRVMAAVLSSAGSVNGNARGITYLTGGGVNAVCKSFLYIHAKMILADFGQATAKAYIGSENFSCVSLGDNRECGILVTEPAILQRLESIYASDWAQPNVAVTPDNTGLTPCPANKAARTEVRTAVRKLQTRLEQAGSTKKA